MECEPLQDSATVSAAELDRIIGELDANRGKLPERAIRECREHRDLIIPKLIESIRQATAAARSGNVPEGNVHFFALFLLTEFAAKDALPAILEAVSLPGELPFELFGDAITSVLARVLAVFSAGKTEMIDGMIGNRTLNEYVRWEAAQVYIHLVRDCHLSRDEAAACLHQHLLRAMTANDEAIITPLVCELVALAPSEAYNDIEEAYRRGLVDTGMIVLDDVKQSAAGGEAWIQKELNRCDPTGIPDTVEELRHWAAFREESPKRSVAAFPIARTVDIPESFAPMGMPVETRSSRVGRNDPCPCGSGKKFKKCCGARR